jgi:hypothetical protein
VRFKERFDWKKRNHEQSTYAFKTENFIPEYNELASISFASLTHLHKGRHGAAPEESVGFFIILDDLAPCRVAVIAPQAATRISSDEATTPTRCVGTGPDIATYPHIQRIDKQHTHTHTHTHTRARPNSAPLWQIKEKLVACEHVEGVAVALGVAAALQQRLEETFTKRHHAL